MRRRALCGLVLLAGALPLLARPAPLQDWPNHVARFHILAQLLAGDPFWTRFYRLSGFWVPNAAMDAAVLGLARLGLPIDVAAQLFLLATYGVFVAGFCMLARNSGAASPAKSALAVLLFYGHTLFWGLVSYVLGTGSLLALLAAWLGARRHWARWVVAGAGAGGLVFIHAVPALAWVVTLAAGEFARFLGDRQPLWRRLGAHASWLAALAVAGTLLRVLPADGGVHAAYAGPDLPGIVARKMALFPELLLGGSVWQDAASAAALVVCVAAVLRARPALASEPAAAVAALLALSLVAPERLGEGSLLDVRLAALPLIVAAATVRLDGSRWADWLASGAVLLRTLVVAAQFRADARVFEQFHRDAAVLPRDSVMLMAFGTPLRGQTWQRIWSPPLTSVATSVVAQGVFMPHIFANPAQQPIALRAAYAGLTQPWDLTDTAHRTASAAALHALCGAAGFTGVYVTELYPGRARPTAGLLVARPDYLLLDACRLR